jgi:hypothetical protein
MNRPALFFAGTTGLFALSTLYLAWQLNQRDAAPVLETAAAARQLPAASTGGSAAAHAGAATATGSPVPGGTPPTDHAPAPGRATAPAEAVTRRGVMLPFARDFLRQYDDLSLRGAQLANARRGLESQYAALRDRLKLAPAAFDQLVSLLAEESLAQQANYFRCVVDAACNLDNVPPPPERSDELLALLGPDGYAQFTSYREAMPEWQSVIQLRGRLPESQYLRDGDAERLRSALTEARKRYAAELQQQGAKLQGWGDGTGMLWYSGDGTVEQRLASATQYAQRVRQQAAAVLSAEQLRLFVQLQDEMLASFAAYLQQAQANPD